MEPADVNSKQNIKWQNISYLLNMLPFTYKIIKSKQNIGQRMGTILLTVVLLVQDMDRNISLKVVGTRMFSHVVKIQHTLTISCLRPVKRLRFKDKVNII